MPMNASFDAGTQRSNLVMRVSQMKTGQTGYSCGLLNPMNKLLGAVDTRRYPRAENRVWSYQEDHDERGSKDRATSTCGPHSDSRSTIRADVGVAIVPQTISRHLEEANLKSKRPFRALPLTPEHQQLRLQWCQARSMWNVTDWQKAVFRDESRFLLGTDYNRVRVWRHPGERYNSPTLFYVTLPTQLV
ncbi:hypothetical protein TNCV_3571421 [Trichonephila clavipes]|nr:hypothetical protein TNCV_3571421 [Trichonephila clavipes]